MANHFPRVAGRRVHHLPIKVCVFPQICRVCAYTAQAGRKEGREKIQSEAERGKRTNTYVRITGEREEDGETEEGGRERVRKAIKKERERERAKEHR